MRRLGAVGECLGDGVRWVGDPVDVVTGALVEEPVVERFEGEWLGKVGTVNGRGHSGR